MSLSPDALPGPLIDGHLDLAYNAWLGRDLSLPLEELRAQDPLAPGQRATVSFPELRAAGLRLCFATLFALPEGSGLPGALAGRGYQGAEEARSQALGQLAQYRRWEDEGKLRLLRRRDVAAHLADPGAPLGALLLMEGADPIRDPGDLPFWLEAGVELIGLAWERTRYAGGTDAPGGLSAPGRELVAELVGAGVTLDASHLDDAAFWEAAELGARLIATHANSRALVPGNRQLSDEMAREIARRGGVIGLVAHSRFTRPGWRDGDPRAPLEELVRHAEHFAGLVGWDRVALGSDLDGGFGAEKTPLGIDHYRDLARFLDLLPPEVRAGVRGGNWQRWLLEEGFTQEKKGAPGR